MTDPSTPSGPKSPSAEYDDGKISTSPSGLRIGTYFMWGGSKKIEYGDIQSVRSWQMGTLTGKWRIWGSGDFKHWFNLDSGRPSKSVGLVIDVGKHWLPVVTPDRPDELTEVLRSHGVNVS